MNNGGLFKYLCGSSSVFIYRLLTSLSYLQHFKGSKDDGHTRPTTEYLPLFGDSAMSDWIENVRVWLDNTLALTNVTMVMPYDGAIAMQAGPVCWVIKYWEGASLKCCNKDTVGACDESNGFLVNGLPVFETSDDIKRARARMKKFTQRCACTTGCSRSCGCRKAGSKCIACQCNRNNCTNSLLLLTQQEYTPGQNNSGTTSSQILCSEHDVKCNS